MSIRLKDQATEEVRRQIVQRIEKVETLSSRVIKDIELADGVERPIAHGLGRTPEIVLVSPVRGASTSGRIGEVRTSVDRSKRVVLVANGWGATVTIDIEVK